MQFLFSCILSDADSDNDDNQSNQPSVIFDNESIAMKSSSSNSDSGYSTVPSSSAVRTGLEIDFDTDPEVFYFIQSSCMSVDHKLCLFCRLTT